MSATCPPGSICSNPSVSYVDGKPYYTFTATKVIQSSDGKVSGGETTLYYSPTPNNYVPSAKTKDGAKTWEYLTYQSGQDIPNGKKEGDTILGAGLQKSLQQGALKTNTNNGLSDATRRAGIPPEQAKNLNLNNKTQATIDPNSDTAKTSAQAAANDAGIRKELDKTTLNARRKKEDFEQLVVYPEKLQLKYQDCIKFTMLEYQQSFLGLGPEATRSQLGNVNRSVTVVDGIPRIGTREPLTTIVLPIPGGISDSNPVGWQDNPLDDITRAFANIAQSAITGGGKKATEAAQGEMANVQADTGSYQAFAASKITELAVGANGIMQRQYGAIMNPNLELLFNGPQLRTFSFTFRLSPRSESEARTVKRIIRYFKQGMTPKRSAGYLLLQSPHTFAISYLTSDKEHPYLNKFKECALTQCNVNYTPDGTYMSYDGKERSMTSYELTLQFQELVPLFDDDYPNDNDATIGF